MEISDELRSFLTSRPRVAKLATVRKKGSPWVQPVWFTLDGDDPILIITRASVAGRTLQREPRAALCVDEVEMPYAVAILEGTFTVTDGPDEAWRWMREIGLWYEPDNEDIDSYKEETMSGGSLICRLKVEQTFYNPAVD